MERKITMSNLVTRLSTRIQYTRQAFHSDCYFSVPYALLRVADEAGGRIGFRRLSQSAHKSKDKWIQNYLQNILSSILDMYKNDSDQGVYQPNAPIWVCWWTGFEHAPDLVKRCIESIYANAKNHPVYLITKENYSEHLEIPGYMLERVAVGHMGLAHLSDYIRVKLLATHGGLWLDATMFVSGKVPEECFDLPVFTCKGPVGECGYISEKRWSTFCLGGWKGNVLYRFLVNAFERYWQTNDRAIDYLFFDHIILIAYTQIPAIQHLLDSIPDNNIHRDDLQAAMNAAVPATDFNHIISAETVLYKLSWRETYSYLASNGTPSVYSSFIDSNTAEK